MTTDEHIRAEVRRALARYDRRVEDLWDEMTDALRHELGLSDAELDQLLEEEAP